MRRVLVTGGSGFIGRHAVRALVERGHEVHLASRAVAAVEAPPQATVHACDLLAPGALEALVEAVRPSDCLHLAWVTAHPSYWRSPENLDWVAATLRLVRALARSGARRFVGGGTCAEYDWAHGHCVEALTPTGPRTLYGAAKHAAHAACAAFAAEAGVSLAWGRPFHVFGPGDAPGRLVTSLARSLVRGERVTCRGPHLVRDLVSAEETGGALAALLDSPVEGAVNIASGRPTTLGAAAEAIAEIAGRRDALVMGNPAAASGEPPVITACVRRLHGEVGWPPRLDLRAALERTVEWARREMAG